MPGRWAFQGERDPAMEERTLSILRTEVAFCWNCDSEPARNRARIDRGGAAGSVCFLGG
jgi:hypothetical protein